MGIRVMIVDDHEIVRRGLKAMLQEEDDLQVAADFDNALDTLRFLESESVDVVLMDVRLPGMTGFELCRAIRTSYPATYCLFLTAYDDPEAVRGAIEAGASGYMLKGVVGSQLVAAIRQVGRGESLLDAVTTSEVMQMLRESAVDETGAHLTPQEERTLDLLGDGLSNRQIAEQLHLSEKTVKNHLSSIFSKLGIERRTQALIYALNRKRGGSGSPHSGGLFPRRT